MATSADSRHYPKSSYVWRLFRRRFLGQPWSKVKASLEVQAGFPKRFRSSKANWWWAKHWTKRYCALFSAKGSPFVRGMGMGVFASKPIKKGSTVLFGHLHRITHAAACQLETAGESSLMQIPNDSGRVDWFYLGGPASLLNHCCQNNAEYHFGERRGRQGEFLVKIKKDVAPGQEVLVHYGDEFWTQARCKCRKCVA